MSADLSVLKPLSSLPIPQVSFSNRQHLYGNHIDLSTPVTLPLFQLVMALAILSLWSLQHILNAFSLLPTNKSTIFCPRFLGPEVCHNSEVFRFRRYHGTSTIYYVKYAVETGNINTLIFWEKFTTHGYFWGKKKCKRSYQVPHEFKSSFTTTWILTPNLPKEKYTFKVFLSFRISDKEPWICNSPGLLQPLSIFI